MTEQPEYGEIFWDHGAREYAEVYGLAKDDVEAIIRSGTGATLDPYTHQVGHLVVRYKSGDVVVVAGYRDKDHPQVLHVSVETHLDQRGGTSKGGGPGSSLPKSDRQLRAMIIKKGYSIGTENHPKVRDKNGQVIFSISGSPSDVRNIANTWKQFIKAHMAHQDRLRRKKHEKDEENEQ